MPTSDVSDMAGKQKSMGLKLTGDFLSPMGDRRTDCGDDYDKGLARKKEQDKEKNMSNQRE